MAWLVGTDGAHSVVRKTLGLDFMGETIEDIETVIGDFRISGSSREVINFDHLLINGDLIILLVLGTLGR